MLIPTGFLPSRISLTSESSTRTDQPVLGAMQTEALLVWSPELGIPAPQVLGYGLGRALMGRGGPQPRQWPCPPLRRLAVLDGSPRAVTQQAAGSHS